MKTAVTYLLSRTYLANVRLNDDVKLHSLYNTTNSYASKQYNGGFWDAIF